jgi:hypothetical protein
MAQKVALDEWNQTTNEWKKQTIDMFGASKVSQELGYASKMIDGYLSSEEATSFRQLLNDTKLGNNPLLNKLLVAAGKSISEPKVIHGSATKNTPKDIETAEELAIAMYKNTK